MQHADGVCTATRDIQAYRGWDMGYQQGWDVGRDCEDPRTIHPSAPGTRRWYRRGYDWGYLAGYAWCQDENDSWETGP